MEGKSPRTIIWHRKKLSAFAKFLQDTGRSLKVSELGIDGARTFIKHLMDRTMRYSDHVLRKEMEGGLTPTTGAITPEMLAKARHNVIEAKLTNVEFREGYLEALPVPDGWADVVISNGVLNLVPNKDAALAEMYCVLKAGGRLQIANIVLQKPMPQDTQSDVTLWAGCIARLLTKPECRLLTLVGPSGIGKTRLAIQAAHDHAAASSANVFKAGLITVGDPMSEVVTTSLLPIEKMPSARPTLSFPSASWTRSNAVADPNVNACGDAEIEPQTVLTPIGTLRYLPPARFFTISH